MTIDENGNRDIYCDSDGNLAFVTDVQGSPVATALILKSRVEAQRGEMIYATDQGMPTRATAWDTFNPKQFEAAWYAIALATQNVASVRSFDMYQAGNTLNYAAVIQTTYGTASVSSQNDDNSL